MGELWIGGKSGGTIGADSRSDITISMEDHFILYRSNKTLLFPHNFLFFLLQFPLSAGSSGFCVLPIIPPQRAVFLPSCIRRDRPAMAGYNINKMVFLFRCLVSLIKSGQSCYLQGNKLYSVNQMISSLLDLFQNISKFYQIPIMLR